MKILISNSGEYSDEAEKITRFYLEKIIDTSCLAGLDFDTIAFDIFYCGSEQIRSINREHRGKDESTDVITFALFADSEPKLVTDGQINLGEIIINTDEENPLLLITHGILHLLGFDHNTDAQYNFVVGMQDEAIRKIKNDEI